MPHTHRLITCGHMSLCHPALRPDFTVTLSNIHTPLASHYQTKNGLYARTTLPLLGLMLHVKHYIYLE